MKTLILMLVLSISSQAQAKPLSKEFVGGMCTMALIVSKVDGGSEALR